jgi:hypothetical protein
MLYTYTPNHAGGVAKNATIGRIEPAALRFRCIALTN